MELQYGLLQGNSIPRLHYVDYVKNIIDNTAHLQGVDRYRTISNGIFTTLKKLTHRPSRNTLMCEYTKQMLEQFAWVEVNPWIVPAMNQVSAHPKAYISLELRKEMFETLKKHLQPQEFDEYRTQIDIGWTVPSEYTETQRPFASSLKVAFGYKGIIHLAKEYIHEHVSRNTLDQWISLTVSRKEHRHKIHEQPLLLIALDRGDAIGEAIMESPIFAMPLLYSYLNMTFVPKTSEHTIIRPDKEKIENALKRYIEDKFKDKEPIVIAHELGKRANINELHIKTVIDQIYMCTTLEMTSEQIINMLENARTQHIVELELGNFDA